VGGLHQNAFACRAALPVSSPEHAISACSAFDLDLDGWSGEPGEIQRAAKENTK